MAARPDVPVCPIRTGIQHQSDQLQHHQLLQPQRQVLPEAPRVPAGWADHLLQPSDAGDFAGIGASAADRPDRPGFARNRPRRRHRRRQQRLRRSDPAGLSGIRSPELPHRDRSDPAFRSVQTQRHHGGKFSP
ncbi:hypothetical protein SDC9_165231 [bioreactor metagenome]|uniref:Uncharacterized protein n=1 Tax=bioreactor metagenome TaxID=1076179 RepID=A0A645FVN4_9ZZZZ